MKESRNGKKLFYLMLLIVVFSLGLTAIIVTGLIDDADGKESKYWFFEESIQTGKPVELKNVYMYKNADEKLEFLYKNVTYLIEGNISQEFVGIADIVVEGDKISKIRIKPDVTIGTLSSYNEEQLEVRAETVSTLIKQENIPVYKVLDGKVIQSSWEDMILGTSKVRCAMEQGKVCAIIIEETVPMDIRVVIKNGKSIFYENLWVKKASDNSIIDVAKAMEGIEKLVIEDTKGLYVCDETGKLQGTIYEGTFRIVKDKQGYVLINQLPIETYVKYVLPSEMPKYFHEEALKAQAVCARTFAYAHIKNQSYAKYGANLDDSTAFQVYHATGRYTETDAAVDATKNEIITCDGEIITCYYFSTSAGKTNDMSVWGSETPKYVASTTSEDTNSPFYQWKSIIDRSDIREIRVVKRNDSNYVTELEIQYIDETVVLKNENDIRRALGEYLKEITLSNGKVRTDLSMIPSASFHVVEMKDDVIVIEGGGFGHGIGLSQYGADKMAESGIGYKDIIAYYYKGVIVKSV